MLSDEIKALMGETDKLDELKALMDKADEIENALTESKKQVEEKDVEIADKNRRLANLFLSVTEKQKTQEEKIKSGEADLSDMTESEFKEAMNKLYGEGTFKETSGLDDLL